MCGLGSGLHESGLRGSMFNTQNTFSVLNPGKKRQTVEDSDAPSVYRRLPVSQVKLEELRV